ncbi:hypothetical protein [Aquimarina sp. Aq107]
MQHLEEDSINILKIISPTTIKILD